MQKIFGFTLFFVNIEPSAFDVIALVLIITNLSNVLRVFLNTPALLILFASQIAALLLEVLKFQSFFWSLISIYLVVLAGLFVHLTRKKQLLEEFITGAFWGLFITVLFAIFAPEFVYPFGPERLFGFFKDPNVLNPTAVYVAIIGASLRMRAPLALAALVTIYAKSRASMISIVASVVASNWILIIGSTLALLWFYSEIISIVELLFEMLGRGGVLNSYDYDRRDNWTLMFGEWARSLLPLGPNWSDINGFSAHNTYLRVLFEQGAVNFLVLFYALYIAFKNSSLHSFIRAGLIFLMVNAVVVDATHWRIFFIAIGVSIGCKFRSRLVS